MVLLEAMACGTPVAASRIGSLDEIVIDGITGIKFSPGDAGELAATVKSLVSEPEKLASMRISARDHFERNYAPSSHVTQLAEIYRDVMQEMKIKAAGHGTNKPARS
jgi:glycosyltransferase involved in cell wall biosynthesis